MFKLLLCMFLFSGAFDTFAAKVILRIRAGNPIDKPQVVQIKSKLPDGVGTNDIIDLGGLELGYDVKNDSYYVHKRVELGGKEIRVYDVEIKDKWIIPEDKLRKIVSRGSKLTEMLKETEYYKTALQLQSDLSKTADELLSYQAENDIAKGVSPLQHIRAYDVNIRKYNQIDKDIGRIENLVLASGQDPGGLIGIAQDVPPPRKVSMKPEDYKTVIFQISVKNSSPNEVRTVDIKRDLPKEILSDDVLDAGDLEVGRDTKRNITYVFKKNVKLAPNQTIKYDVKIRDKWNINDPRIKDLRTRINDVIGQIGEKDQYKSVDDDLKRLLNKVNKIKNQQGPDELNSEYVAFYREQSRQLDNIEKEIYRIEAALRPVEKKAKRGFKVQPPSLKTTWLIIYIILGFLGVISLLFFLRWMTKSKPEKIEESSDGE